MDPEILLNLESKYRHTPGKILKNWYFAPVGRAVETIHFEVSSDDSPDPKVFVFVPEANVSQVFQDPLFALLPELLQHR